MVKSTENDPGMARIYKGPCVNLIIFPEHTGIVP